MLGTWRFENNNRSYRFGQKHVFYSSVHDKRFNDPVGWTPVHHCERCHQRNLLRLSLFWWAGAHPTEKDRKNCCVLSFHSLFAKDFFQVPYTINIAYSGLSPPVLA
jgi:hypothetical protein